MADPARGARSQHGRDDAGVAAIDDLLSGIADLRSRLQSPPRGGPDGAAAGRGVRELELAELPASARQIEALVALGVLGRLVSGGEARIVWMAAETESRAAAELAGLRELAGALRAAMRSTRTVADDAASVGRLVEREVGPRQIEALVALGLLGRMISGGSSSLVWTGHGLARLEPVGRADEVAVGDGAGAPSGSERFELDRATDYEHELLLMYRVILAFEIVAAIVLVRELVLGL